MIEWSPTLIFNNQFTVNVEKISNIIPKTLNGRQNQQWRESLSMSMKGRLYGQFKLNLELSPYFSNIPFQYALSIDKLKTCNFRFPIEVFALQGMPYYQRKRHLCSTYIGDLYHYILVCNHFHHIRLELLPIRVYYTSHPSIVKYNELINSNNTNLL